MQAERSTQKKIVSRCIFMLPLIVGSTFLCPAGPGLSLSHTPEEPAPPPLHQAARTGNWGLIRTLCQTEDIAQKDQKGRQALHFASAAPHPSIPCAIELLQAGADMYAEDMSKQSPFLYAIAAGSYPLCLLFLGRRKAAGTPLLSESEKSLGLAIAALHGNEDIVKLLLNEADAPVNVQALEYGGTPLHWSVIGQHVRISRYLLDHGAHINTPSSHKQRTPLHCAVASGKYDLVELLVTYGADTDLEDDNGRTPLEEALKLRKLYILPLLREQESGQRTVSGTQTELSPLNPSISS